MRQARFQFLLSLVLLTLVLTLLLTPRQPFWNTQALAAPQQAGQRHWQGKTHLTFSGGIGNFPRVGAWLISGLFGQFPPGQFTGEVLITGNGYGVEMRNIQDGYAQLAVTIPAATPYMASKGIGLFANAKPNPNLRGFFKLPRRTFVTFAIRQDLGATTLDEVVQKKIPLKLATGAMDGEDTMTFVCLEILKGYGLSLDQLKAQGGEIVSVGINEVPALTQGRANAFCAQGTIIDAGNWRELNTKVPMRMVSIKQEVIDQLATYGFKKYPSVFRKGSYPSVLDDVTTVDYAHWIVVGDASIPDDVGYKIAAAAVAGIPGWLNIGYDRQSFPDAENKLGLIVPTPEKMWQDLGVPLHSGAARFFKEKGYMP